LNATLPDTPVPTTFVVTVVDAGGNKYAINGVTQDTIQFTPGLSYVFDQSDSSNAGHPIAFYEDAGKTVPYTAGVSSSGIAGTEGARTTIDVSPSIAVTQLYYQCQAHAGMGGLIEVS